MYKSKRLMIVFLPPRKEIVCTKEVWSSGRRIPVINFLGKSQMIFYTLLLISLALLPLAYIQRYGRNYWCWSLAKGTMLSLTLPPMPLNNARRTIASFSTNDITKSLRAHERPCIIELKEAN